MNQTADAIRESEWDDPYAEGVVRSGVRCPAVSPGGSPSLPPLQCMATDGHSQEPPHAHRWTSSVDGRSLTWRDGDEKTS